MGIILLDEQNTTNPSQTQNDVNVVKTQLNQAFLTNTLKIVY